MSYFVSSGSEIKVGPYSTTVTTSLSPVFPTTPILTTIPSIFDAWPSTVYQSNMYPSTLWPTQNVFSPTSMSVAVVTPIYDEDIDTGLNQGYLAQKQMVQEILHLTLDKWLYKDMCYLLKYLKITDGKVDYISSLDEYKENKICEDSTSNVQLKADFIEENILDEEKMRKLLKKIINELGYKWYDLISRRRAVVKDTIETYLKSHLKKGVETKNK